MRRARRTVVLVGVLVGAGIAAEALLTHGAEARAGRGVGGVGGVGAPGPPVAGVARRTTRRVVRRSAIYVATLPHGCTTIVVEGATIHQCGSTYYQAYGNQYEVVYLDD